MATSKKYSHDELAKLGIQVETPSIEVLDEQPSIDPISTSDLSKVARDEAFMNERIKIRLATTTDPNAPPYAIVTVNDVHNRAVIPRGQPVYVKRMHVEVMARMRETRYSQPVRNMADPESGNYLVPQHAMVYPFEVIEDPNPMGRPWLERILAEPTY